MPQNISIDVHHLTRVEGHGNILVNVTDGVVERCEWQVPEAPRFFEAMCRGRHYSEVARITSRICGICSIGHTLASVKATEAALGIEVTPQTRKLRTLLKHAENFDSHVLHVYVLVAPDLLGAPSAFALVPTHGEIVARALRLKRLAHEWGSLIGGRTTHPDHGAARRLLEGAHGGRALGDARQARGGGPGPSGDARDDRLARAGHPRVRSAHRVHGGVVRRGVRALRRLRADDPARRRSRPLRGRRLSQLHQRVRLAARRRRSTPRTASTATPPVRSRAST